MSADYDTLAPIYNTIGMADFAEIMAPRLIEYAQSQLEWMGRRLLDLGCGTGVIIPSLINYGYIITAVDRSPAMLDAAHQLLGDRASSANLQPGDMRDLDPSLGPVDMVLALDVFNEVNNLREIETAFQSASRVLEPGKLLIFDLYTIQGVTERGQSSDRILYNGDDLVVFATNIYDYDRQMNTRHFIIFQREGETWVRREAERTLRAFPTPAIASLLQRNGFHIRQVLDLRFEPFEPGISSTDRVIFLAEKSS